MCRSDKSAPVPGKSHQPPDYFTTITAPGKETCCIHFLPVNSAGKEPFKKSDDFRYCNIASAYPGPPLPPVSRYSIPPEYTPGSQRSGPPRENKPESGSVSLFSLRVATGKHRYSLLFISCGEYGQSSSRLQKYGRFPPHQMVINGLWTALVFATCFYPSGPEKGCRNANIRPVFYDGDP